MARGLAPIGFLGLLSACGGDPGLPCEGGGSASALVGSDEASGFVPFDEGDPIAVQETSTGERLRFDYQVTGLDTREPVTVVLRLGRQGAGTEDYLASANLSCTDPGPAEYGAWADWPSDWPSPASMDGQGIEVTTVFTDHTGDVAEVAVGLVVDAAR